MYGGWESSMCYKLGKTTFSVWQRVCCKCSTQPKKHDANKNYLVVLWAFAALAVKLMFCWFCWCLFYLHVSSEVAAPWALGHHTNGFCEEMWSNFIFHVRPLWKVAPEKQCCRKQINGSFVDPPTQRNSWPSGAWSIMNAVYTLISTVCSQGSSGGQKLIQNMVGKIHTNLVLIKTLVLYATFYSIILHIWQAFVSKCVYNLLNYLKSSN